MRCVPGLPVDLAVQLGVGHYAFSEEIYENDQLVRVDRYSLWGGGSNRRWPPASISDQPQTLIP